jgi:hypothetical protein
MRTIDALQVQSPATGLAKDAWAFYRSAEFCRSRQPDRVQARYRCTGNRDLTNSEAFFQGSRIYEPVAVLRRGDEILCVARVGMKASRQFMILTPTGDSAWPHEPLGSLSDVAWALRAHEWHDVSPEAVGENGRPAKTLARLLIERA